MAPWAASTISSITLPLSSAFYHRPFYRDLSNSKKKKEREIWKEQDRASEGGGTTRSASAAPSACLQSWLWKSAADEEGRCWKKVWKQISVGRKQEWAVQPLQRCYCVFSLRLCQPPFFSLACILTSVCFINIITEAWCCYGEQCHTAPVQYSVQCWTGMPLWVGCRGFGARVPEAVLF